MPNTSRYFQLKAAGICTRCCKAPPAEGRGQCAPCVEAEAIARPLQMKRRYHARIAAGVCSRCGKRPPSEGMNECDECRAYTADRAAKATEATKARRLEYGRNWIAANPERNRQRSNRYRQKLRAEAFARYGTVCQCCGEANWAFLTLDHIANDGNAHRRELFGNNISGRAFYKEMRKAGWPDGLQTLCYNCNMAKAHYGVCPHQIQAKDLSNIPGFGRRSLEDLRKVFPEPNLAERIAPVGAHGRTVSRWRS